MSCNKLSVLNHRTASLISLFQRKKNIAKIYFSFYQVVTETALYSFYGLFTKNTA